LLEQLKTGSKDAQAALDNLLYYRMGSDVELFTSMFFPHYATESFNDFHKDLFKAYRFDERSVRRLRIAPRGYAKSTISAFVKPIHDLCYKLERFIVIISNTEPQAKQKLKDIRAELLSNDELINFYGIGFLNKKAGETDFIASCEEHQCRFIALGSGTEIRGIRFGAYRPSKIVLDDIEHSTKVYNEAIRDGFEDWYNDVVTKIGNTKTNIEFIGTVLHPKALLVKTSKNPSYESKSYQAVKSWAENQELWADWKAIYTNLDDENRQEKAEQFYLSNKEEMDKGAAVLWPDKEPYYYLMKELIETGRRSFYKEKMNKPISDEECLFDREQFHYFRETKDGLYIKKSGVTISWKELRAYGVIDPSTGQQPAKRNKKGDYTALITGYTDSMGRLFVVNDVVKRMPPTDYIQRIFDLHEQYEYEKFAVETNLYRNLLLPNILEERKQREKRLKKKIKIPFYDIINTENKIKRIHTLEPKISHGWILFNETLSEEYFTQFDGFPKEDHDDAPDATEMLWNLVNGRYDKGAITGLNAMVGR
jgi:predicted phage terminase large subunit-like protein